MLLRLPARSLQPHWVSDVCRYDSILPALCPDWRRWAPEDWSKLIGRVFDDRYEVLRKLGSGGMADVYLADDRLLGREVALKILSSRYVNDEQFIERFRREASSAASLNHPNIVQIYDRGEAEGTYYIAMEYLEGRSLKEIILKYAPLSSELVVSVSIQILEALRFAHRRDVIHRDIKPQNIIIDSEGRAKVTDFGIARAGSASSMTEAGSILGTAHYLSPEQAQGLQVEAASDLYSLGVVMYEMATGVLPFDGDNPVALAMRHVHDLPEPPSSIVPGFPANLEAVIMHALGKTPTERYLTAQQFLEDLAAVQQGRDIHFPVTSSEQATRVMTGAALPPLASQKTTVRRRESPPVADPQALPSAYAGPPPRRRGSIWPWILVAILIVALAGGAYAILSSWKNPAAELIAVPGVLSLTEAEARDALARAGFEMKVEGDQPSADVEKDYIARQEPGKDAKAPRGSTVSVWLSSGPGLVKVPPLVGKTQIEAAAELGALDLKPNLKEEENKDEQPGTVLRQDPEPGTEVEAGSTVTIVVAKGVVTAPVPLLVGFTQEAAEAKLELAKLTAKIEQVDAEEAVGMVVDQKPQAGELVAPNSEVIIRVSKGPAVKMVQVPKVVGRTRDQAIAILGGQNLEAYVVVRETADYSPNMIFDQDPKAETKVEEGSTVRIFVAKAPPTTTTTLPPTTSTTAPPTTTPPPTHPPDTTEETAF